MDKQDRNYKMDKQDRNYIAMATARWKRETDPVKRDRLQAIHEHCVGKKPGPLPYREDAIEALRAFRLPIRGMSDHARLNQSNQINEVIKRLNGT